MSTLDDATELQNRWSQLGQRVAASTSVSSATRARVNSDSQQFVNWLSARKDSFISHMASQADQLALAGWSERFNSTLDLVRSEEPQLTVTAFHNPSSTVTEAVSDAASSLTGLGMGALVIVALLAMRRK